MNFNKLLQIGEVFKTKYKVEESDSADYHGNKGVRVLSTPSLLKYIESGSSVEVFNRLPEGFSPVGISIELKHIAATPINGIIEVVSEVSNVQETKFTYNFKVFYKDKIIAKGTYGQAIVDLKDFLNKNNDV